MCIQNLWAVAKAFSNDSSKDDLVDTEEEDLGKDDADKHNVRLVSRKSVPKCANLKCTVPT